MNEAKDGARFIVLDGVDGCGKSTQAKRLVERLARAGSKSPLHLREPGSTAIGERIRAMLLGREHEISARTEALLFCAARSAMLEELVAPALAEGRTVVCERFHPSTFAYQGVAGGLGEERVLALLSKWAGEPRPDLVLILDVEPEVAARRRGGALDRIEDKGLEFQRRVARGMRRYAELVEGCALIDASPDANVVENSIWREVSNVLR